MKLGTDALRSILRSIGYLSLSPKSKILAIAIFGLIAGLTPSTEAAQKFDRPTELILASSEQVATVADRELNCERIRRLRALGQAYGLAEEMLALLGSPGIRFAVQELDPDALPDGLSRLIDPNPLATQDLESNFEPMSPEVAMTVHLAMSRWEEELGGLTPQQFALPSNRDVAVRLLMKRFDEAFRAICLTKQARVKLFRKRCAEEGVADKQYRKYEAVANAIVDRCEYAGGRNRDASESAAAEYVKCISTMAGIYGQETRHGLLSDSYMNANRLANGQLQVRPGTARMVQARLAITSGHTVATSPNLSRQTATGALLKEDHYFNAAIGTAYAQKWCDKFGWDSMWCPAGYNWGYGRKVFKNDGVDTRAEFAQYRRRLPGETYGYVMGVQGLPGVDRDRKAIEERFWLMRADADTLEWDERHPDPFLYRFQTDFDYAQPIEIPVPTPNPRRVEADKT